MCFNFECADIVDKILNFIKHLNTLYFNFIILRKFKIRINCIPLYCKRAAINVVIVISLKGNNMQ